MRETGYPVVGSWPERLAARFGNRPALVFEGREYGYAELAERSRRLAGALSEAGVRSGDRVAHLGPNQPAALDTLFASTRLGAVFVPVSPRLAPAEVGHLLGEATPRVVVCSAESRSLLEAALEQAPQTGLSKCGQGAETGGGAGNEELFPSPRVIATASTGRAAAAYEALLADAPRHGGPASAGPDDLAFLLFTSGTTGRPKGVMLTHANVLFGAVNLEVMGLGPRDIHLAFAPVSRSGGLFVLLAALRGGSTVVLLPEFDPERILSLIPRRGVTNLFGGPDTYRRLLESPGFAHADLSTVRFGISGGAPMPRHLLEAYLRRGLPLTQGYGLTETAPLALYLGLGDAERKLGSVGTPPFFTDVRLLDPDADDPPPGELGEVHPGEIGEVVVRGPNVTAGYWRHPELTAAVWRHGWFHTGDAARVDGEGFYFLVDRLKDVYSVGDDNVFPAEIEQVLAAHPGVAEAAVIGVPDAETGQAGAAYVVAAASAGRLQSADLRDYLRSRLASYKVPKHVVLVESLPQTATGKVAKARLGEEFRT